ncbi:MAG TPA: hypothetical protein VK961_16815 [Chthoniobacter sp.]|nr:hypothetical protein [Chthoniobacter sp.]
MRKFFTLLWLLCPVAALYYHFNEGQHQVAREKARHHIEAIRTAERAKEPDWAQIIEEYDKLSAELPKDERPLVRHQIRLAKAGARLELLDVAGAIDDLTLLLSEAAQTHGEDAPITRAAREKLGKAYYYATYLLKTNGAAEEEWRPYAERTRQIFRFLAEHQEPGALTKYEERVQAEFFKTTQR